MKTTIRKIRKYDHEFVRSLFLQAGQESREASNRFFESDRNLLLVAFQNNSPCGFLYAYLLHSLNSSQPKMFLYSIDVFDNHKRRGIGARLVDRLKRISKHQNCSEIFVLTNRSNISAMNFYRKTGGRRESRDDVMFVYPSRQKKRNTTTPPHITSKKMTLRV